MPDSATPVNVAAVRLTQTLPPPGADLNVSVADVAGLDAVLADRPVKGPGWLAHRAVVADVNGKLAAASGALNDCVKVDGSAGPCGAGGGGGAPGTYAANVRPTRVSEVIWTLPDAPSPASSVICAVNGLRHTYGVDYTVAGNTITWVAAHMEMFTAAQLNQDATFIVSCDYWRP